MSIRIAIKRIKGLKEVIGAFFILGLLIGTIETLSYYQQCRYDIENYNCLHMSEDWDDFFSTAGINSTIMYGEKILEDGNKTAHCWLRLNLGILGTHEFESTRLKFKDVSDGYDYVGVWDE